MIKRRAVVRAKVELYSQRSGETGDMVGIY